MSLVTTERANASVRVQLGSNRREITRRVAWITRPSGAIVSAVRPESELSTERPAKHRHRRRQRIPDGDALTPVRPRLLASLAEAVAATAEAEGVSESLVLNESVRLGLQARQAAQQEVLPIAAS